MRPAAAICTCALILLFNLTADAQTPPNGQTNTQSSSFIESLPDALTDEESRLTTGLESAGVSASDSTQHLLIDFMLTSPLAGPKLSRTQKPHFGAWFNARLNGTATTSIKGVKQFVGGFENDLISGETSALINTLSFRAGIETKVPWMNGADLKDDYQVQVLFVASAGFVTPPPPQKPAIFEVSPEARERWKIPEKVGETAVKHIGFIEPDRKTFYPRWEFGVRVKTHHFVDCDEHPTDCETRRENFPGIIDITWGQNSSITGGRFGGTVKDRAGKVVSIDAFYPLPTESLANAIYLFGSANLQTLPRGESPEQKQIILKAATASVQVPSDELFLYTPTAQERSRDQWKFGLGFDLIRLFKLTDDSRAEDRAAAARESGFSRVRLYPAAAAADDKEVTVSRVIVQPNETGRVTHVTDILLPLTTGTFREVSSGAGSGTVTFVADEPQLRASTRRELTNVGADQFSMLMVRVNPGEAKSEGFAKFDESKSFELKPYPVEKDARYELTVVTCPAKCDVKSPKHDNLLVVIPLVDSAATKLTIDGKEQTWKRHAPVVIERKADVSIADGAAKFLVVRLK